MFADSCPHPPAHPIPSHLTYLIHLAHLTHSTHWRSHASNTVFLLSFLSTCNKPPSSPNLVSSSQNAKTAFQSWPSCNIMRCKFQEPRCMQQHFLNVWNIVEICGNMQQASTSSEMLAEILLKPVSLFGCLLFSCQASNAAWIRWGHLWAQGELATATSTCSTHHNLISFENWDGFGHWQCNSTQELGCLSGTRRFLTRLRAGPGESALSVPSGVKTWRL